VVARVASGGCLMVEGGCLGGELVAKRWLASPAIGWRGVRERKERDVCGGGFTWLEMI